MNGRNLNAWGPSHGENSAGELEMARALAQYVDRLSAGEVANVQDFLAQSPHLAHGIALELQTIEEVGSIVEFEEHPTTFGDFRLMELIGRGGMGIVREAWQTSLNRSVALKILPPGLLADSSAVKRFHREALVAASLHHPNIVEVYMMGVEGGTPYFAMELVKGETLQQIERRRQSTRLRGNTPLRDSEPTTEGLLAVPLSPVTRDVVGGNDPQDFPGRTALEHDATTAPSSSARRKLGGVASFTDIDAEYCKEIAEIFAGAAEGLQHAHSHGVVHRDLKPSNLILDSYGRLRILDFGLAWVEGQSKLTVSRERPGTLLYMSPEQAQGRSDIFGPATDVYSFGATLYEMLTERRPLEGKTAQETLHLIAHQDPPRPRRVNANVPRDLETIVMKCLRKDPRERYDSAEALAEDLRRFVRGEMIKAYPLPLGVRLARRAWRRRKGLLEAAGVIILAGALAFLGFQHDRNRRREENQRLDAIVSGAGGNLLMGGLSSRARTIGQGLGRRVAAGLARDPSLVEGAFDGGVLGVYEATANVFEAAPTAVSIEPESVLEAVSQLNEVASSRPKDPIARYYLARAALIQGNSKEAKAYLRETPCIAALCLRAALLGEEKDPGAAAAFADVERAAATPGNEWAHWLFEVQQAELDQDWAAAIEAYEKLVQIRPELYPGSNFELKLGLGVAHLRDGQLDLARDDFASCKGARPDRPEPALLLGRVRYLLRDTVNAANAFSDLFRSANESKSNADEIAASIAATYRDLNDTGAALEWSAKMQVDGPRKLRLEADLLSRLDRGDEALAAGQRAVALDPRNLDGHIVLGNIFLARRDFAEASKRYALAGSLSPADARPLVGEGICLEVQGRLRDARQQLEKAIELDPRLGEAHYALGRVLAKVEKPEEAIDSLEQAIRLDPGNALAFNNLGSIFYRIGKLDDALDQFSKAVKLSPLLGIAHFNLGHVYHRQRMFGKAVNEYQMAVELGVQDAELYISLGPCLQWSGRLEAAIEANKKAIKLAPGNALVHYNQGSAYSWAKDEWMAEREYALAAKLRPDWAAAHCDHGCALEALGRYTEALAEYQEASRLDPTFVWSHSNEATLLLRRVLPFPTGDDLAAGIQRLEEASSLPTASPGIGWLLEKYRGKLLPDIASYASVDAVVDGPQPLIAEGEKFSFLRGSAAPSQSTEWTEVSYDDSGWDARPGPFGYPKEGGMATVLDDMRGGYTSLYLRRRFTVSDPGRVEKLLLSVRADDGFVAYLNGHEVGRVRAGEEGTILSRDAVAESEEGSAWMASAVSIDPTNLERGENVLAVQGFNYSLTDDDFSLSPVLAAVYVFDDARRAELEQILGAFRAHAEAAGRDASGTIGYFEGRILEKSGESSGAEPKFLAARALDGSGPELLLRVSERLRARGDAAGAERLLRQALDSELKIHGSLWNAWIRVSLVDLRRDPGEMLKAFPTLVPDRKQRDAHFNPRLQDDLHWLVGQLAAEATLRINCGGSDHRDAAGKTWSRDRFYRAGWADYVAKLDPLVGTLVDVALYQTQRTFNDPGPRMPGYSVPLPAGNYRVTLHFLEGAVTEAGKRLFDVLLEGRPALPRYDPFKAGHRAADLLPFEISVTDGALDIDFVRRVGSPNISAIEIERL